MSLIQVVMASADPTHDRPTVHCRAPVAESAVRRFDTGDGSYVVVQSGQAYEVLKGTRAFRHLSDKRLAHPERFLGMGSALASRGYRPTDTIFVERSLTPKEALDALGKEGEGLIRPLLSSTTYSNSQGEQIFWSWDDGNDGTWEGSQYVERYSDHAWVTYDGQLDISNTNGDAIWSQKTGGSSGITPENQVSFPGAAGHSDVRLAGFFGNLDEEFKDWAVCITGGCLACAGGCLFTGPAYPVCYGSCCFGVSIACAFDYYFG
jgi:hypothetical protein